MRKSLFAYGSLSEGMVHYSKVAEFIKVSEPAWARGEVYRLQVGFPVFLTQGDQRIAGSLIEMQAPDTFWHLLDEFHGFDPSNIEKSLFVRQEISVEMNFGDRQACEVYALNPRKLPSSATRIDNGDWKTSLETTPALTATLSERQKVYIKRLGASVGRDIVPIDLSLYRELMSLSLIVDKGRRLALSFGSRGVSILELSVPVFNIVLIEPEIPANAGNIGRTCVGLNSALHLVGPLGFDLSDKQMKRAGLDYWKDLTLLQYASFEEWWQTVEDPKRVHFFSTKVKKPYTKACFQHGDWFVFGKETAGLAPEILSRFQDQTLTIPMLGPIRSLNLSNAVAIVAFEAFRQLGTCN